MPSDSMQPVDASRVELGFVLAPGQNLFFVELVAALQDEAVQLGHPASVHVGNFPPPRRDLVYVLVPPHEYFTLTHGRIGPSPETLKRTIFICAEQPGTSFFDENVVLAPRGGAVFDINRHAVRTFGTRGIHARHLQLGWTAQWDHLRERERDIDVLFMGCLTDRRGKALADYARTLGSRRTCYVLSDNSQPNSVPSGSFVVDDDKWDLLGRSKVLLNVHQGDSPYFEWLRVLQAASNGAVVVTEHSVDYEPLVPGRHFLTASVDSLGLLAEGLLSDGDRRSRIQAEAYRTIRQDLPLRTTVSDLVATARDMAADAPLPAPSDPFFHQPEAENSDLPLFRNALQPSSPSRGNHNAAVLRRITKDLKLELLDLRRHITRIEVALGSGRAPANVELVSRSRAWGYAQPGVSVLVALYNHETEIVHALDSLLRSSIRSWELIVVDDGSSDGSREAAAWWMKANEREQATLLAHPVNRGLGPARNTALAWARGEYVFVLDADNEIYPLCLERLVATLDADSNAAFAYTILERFRGSDSLGLTNTFAWDPTRFRTGNYIDAMALIRTALVRERFGGYTTDRRLHGWEDFDLWCKIAQAGLYGVFLPEILGRYRTTEHSMLSLTNISATEAYSLLIERYPTLMSGVIPPD
jgi:hypothetical protein